MQITKRHNLEELVKMGYVPMTGEKFIHAVGRREVEFVKLETSNTGSSSSLENGKWITENIYVGVGAIYKDAKGRRCHIYPLSQLSKEVTYEINFK